MKVDIPVMVSLRIPVEVQDMDTDKDVVGELHGSPVVCVLENPALIEQVTEAVNTDENRQRIMDALEHLLSGAYLYLKNHAGEGVKGSFTYWAGFADEIELK